MHRRSVLKKRRSFRYMYRWKSVFLGWLTVLLWLVVPILGALAEEAAYPPLVVACGRTRAFANTTTGADASASRRESSGSATGSADAAVLLFRRQVHPPRKEATIVLSSGAVGVPLVDGLVSQVEYELVNVGKTAAVDVRVYEDAANFPALAFQRVGWPELDSKKTSDGNMDMTLLFDGLVLPPGARYARNLSVIPHTHELEAARVAVYTIPSFLEPVHVYELRPAQVQYKIEGHGTYHTGLSSTETFLVVESARGFDRRALWHPQAWFAYLGSAGLLGVLPWLKARRLFKQIRVRPSRTS